MGQTTTVSYLEQRNRPDLPEEEPPLPGLELRYLPNPEPAFYLDLYQLVGGPWHWWERLAMPETELAELLADPLVEVRVAYVERQPVGFGELDFRQPEEVELKYLGLLPNYIGPGLGSWLLARLLRRAWSRPLPPRRVWLHTCDLDHPRAIEFYRQAGFELYKTETESVNQAGQKRPFELEFQ